MVVTRGRASGQEVGLGKAIEVGTKGRARVKVRGMARIKT